MKVVILAGGYGTRIGEESQLRPKPLIEIGEKPIICHIMSIYSKYGYNDFIICLGYKGYMIKEYFAHYFLHQSDVTFDFRRGNEMILHNRCQDPWKVTLIDTGKDTMTGGRIKRIQPFVGEEPFMLTYGDGVGNIDIAALVAFHQSHGKLATITAVQPPGRFGALDLEADGQVKGFQEKPSGDGGWINAGFFVLQPEVFSYLGDDATVFEQAPLERLAQSGKLAAYRHSGFWQPMDTMRDKNYLESLWKSGKAEWR
ncbi:MULTISPECIES: glucose-1-phosphate cytidylyltransferase [Brevibacillus]|jgi:glucose-1-phosphate cytidylyltransferase|uniref:glucose-1-phosphate cytidylyltransferase n=1 Tax=Brevibacillus TaxID=55080 RepID=UPI000ED8899D|nr:MULTISPECIES: glucose-1-phosphate cytidylyltransferase [Brevibacillus]MBU8713137.1 glucose-1-phosphate cytidylyltransferase [Brevibacillus parabrevis]MDH6348665.1 glucose-1-phosphate cytidylyltransferase [Brevibacillus sp. 1238]MDR5002192.1 glucose-1-phosphate cytidylyltransferase [Brevibacillus parabrevis]NRQ53168.1 glucose-1-phosphate cytidylyltransferase [Brevibacillus sp. HD1.4A]UED70801.1 glucose-1-phosphate cytidylyltransferase [Brevibacillus sp. HD3.3A]